MGRQQGWLIGRDPGGDRRAPAPSKLARLRSCGERARRHEPLQKRKRTSSSELWPRPSALTGTSCERRRQPRVSVARARLLRVSARAARTPRSAAGGDWSAGSGGGGAGWGDCGGGGRALSVHKCAVRPPGMRLSHFRGCVWGEGLGLASPRPTLSLSHLPGRWPVGGARTGEGPSRAEGLRDMGSREASVTLLSRARTARVGHKACCTEKRNSGKNRALWRAVLSVAQIKDRPSWVPIWTAECKEGLKFNRHLAASGSPGEESPEGTNYPEKSCSFPPMAGSSLLIFSL